MKTLGLIVLSQRIFDGETAPDALRWDIDQYLADQRRVLGAQAQTVLDEAIRIVGSAGDIDTIRKAAHAMLDLVSVSKPGVTHPKPVGLTVVTDEKVGPLVLRLEFSQVSKSKRREIQTMLEATLVALGYEPDWSPQV